LRGVELGLCHINSCPIFRLLFFTNYGKSISEHLRLNLAYISVVATDDCPISCFTW